jgi:hypothetical protein
MPVYPGALKCPDFVNYASRKDQRCPDESVSYDQRPHASAVQQR